jgi:hypothetical protein
MFSSVDKGFVIFCILFINSVSAAEKKAQSKPASLKLTTVISAQPARCITLNQGRKCFATVTLNWQTPQIGDYCVYAQAQKKLIHCWKSSRQDSTIFEFESSENIHYQLISSESKQVIAETAVEVSWVHKASPRKRRWRLF